MRSPWTELTAQLSATRLWQRTAARLSPLLTFLRTTGNEGVGLPTLLYLFVASSGLAIVLQNYRSILGRSQPVPREAPLSESVLVAPTTVAQFSRPALPAAPARPRPARPTTASDVPAATAPENDPETPDLRSEPTPEPPPEPPPEPTLPSPLAVLNLTDGDRARLAAVADRRWDGRRWYLSRAEELRDYLSPQQRDRRRALAANRSLYPSKEDYRDVKLAEYRQFVETRPRLQRLIVGSSIALSIPDEFLGVNDFNLGVPADRLRESRAQVAKLDGDRPPQLAVVFGAATPELLNHAPPADILRDALALVEALRRKYPETPVVFVSVLPRSRDDELIDPRMADVDNAAVDALNRALAETFAAEPAVRFLDLDPYLTDGDGYLKRVFSTDGLHPNAQGTLVLMKLLDVLDGG